MLRIQKVLEDANLKVTSVISDFIGMSGRAMIAEIIQGEQDPGRLFDLCKGRLSVAPCGHRGLEGPRDSAPQIPAAIEPDTD
jgi:hypothetical protein